MATFSFWAGESSAIDNLSGSGLGFFGDGFGQSIRVGEYNSRTFICSSDGVTAAAEADNVKYYSSASGILGQAGTPVNLVNMPNERASLNVRFTHASNVQVQQAKLYFYDRVSENNAPSGVTVKAAELIHVRTAQDATGSGDTAWVTPAGSGVTLDLCNSPGPAGQYAGNGSNSTWAATQHDWYAAVSISPDSIGSKLFAVLARCEYF